MEGTVLTKNHLRSFIEVANFAKLSILVLDSDKTIVDISHRLCQLFQAKKNDLLHNNYDFICKKYNIKNLLDIYQQNVNAHEIIPNLFEQNIQFQDKTHYINWVIVPISIQASPSLKKPGYFMIGMEATSFYHDALMQKTYLENIVACMPGSIYWKDKNGVYLGCNDHVVNMAGVISANDIIGKTDYDFSWKDVADSVNAVERSIIESGIPKELEISGKLADGTEATFLTTKKPLRDEHGNILGIVATSLDITKRKEMEDKLALALTELERANRTKDEFIANMSHDIRTPITGILGLAQSLKDSVNDEEQKKDAGLLINTTNELLNLLNGIIEIISLENGQSETKNEVFSIRDLADHNISLLSSAAKHRKINLKLSISNDMDEYVNGNRVYLDRILLNLLSNAIKFTTEGKIELSIKTKFFKKNIAHVEFKLIDTGIGIPKDKQQEIFEPFLKLTPSHQGIYKGNGIGLYTVKQYVIAMNGTISVDSIEGKGTTFTVLVPLHRAVEPVRSVKKALSKEPKFFETNAPTPVPAFEIDHPLAKVLVVEDDCLAARMVRQILQKCRCASDLAKSGKEALQYIEKTKYDLILTDIGLPDLDGFRLTHLIRHLESNNSTTPIIALTGHISADKKQECLEAGMQDMLSKPTTRDEIANLLSKYVPKIDDDSDGPKNKLEEKFDLPIDLTLGASLAGGSVKDAEDMIAMLIESLNQEVPSLNKAFQIRDYEMMYSIVHKVYGGLCYCGAPRLRALMLDLKNALVSKTYAPMGSLMDRVDSELDSLKKTALELNIKSTND